MRELKLLQDDNARLKKLVAALSLDEAVQQDINSKLAQVRTRYGCRRLHLLLTREGRFFIQARGRNPLTACLTG